MAEKRLIDAEALRAGLREAAFESDVTVRDMLTMIDLFPAVDAVEVVHGRWESDMYFDEPVMRCTACKRGFAAGHKAERFPFCPNCGAKMGAQDMDVPTKAGGADK